MWLLISSNLGCCLQDTILVIPPYPYCIEEVPQDVHLEDCWYAHQHLAFMWLLQPTWWAEFPWSPCSWLVTQPQPFLTSTASTRVLASLQAAVTLQMQMESVAAMCMRWTSGCGDLHVASRAWVVCQLRRLMTGRMLLKRYGLSAELRLAGVARLIGPDWKWSVVVNKVHTSTYCVCTLYIRVCTCIYHVGMETVILEGI